MFVILAVFWLTGFLWGVYSHSREASGDPLPIHVMALPGIAAVVVAFAFMEWS